MKTWKITICVFVVTVSGLLPGLFKMFAVEAEPEPSQGWTLLAWNDLGMHCMDEDFSVFAILPPFNTLNASLINKSGQLVDNSNGVKLYYEAAVDPDGSQTKASALQTNFWENAEGLFGVALPSDTGLFGNTMPGVNNTPQPMHWSGDHLWWTAEGIPIIPSDSLGITQAYPLIRLTARDQTGSLLASTIVTAPVSAEMNCVTCHASNSATGANPPSGWVNDQDPVRDYRLNILKLHDDRHSGSPVYSAALAEHGFPAAGLYKSVVDEGRAVLCASCHSSNALATAGSSGVPPLTRAMHAGHLAAVDPISGIEMGQSTFTASCYQCHPGKETRCLRGAMGRASDNTGQPLMSCQSCHGGMANVGSVDRTGWFDEPNCQSCHCGTHTNNAGQLRFINALTDEGILREPADDRFATAPDSPAPGVSLFRFSHGHGGLTCSACHGSPHAIYPTSERNDNLQSLNVQGHVGTIGDCAVCHQNDVTRTQTVTGGPHGMHGIGTWWINGHHDYLPELNDARDVSACMACHNTDSAGGELSKALGPRSFNIGKFGVVTFWQGQKVGCYDCHNGPSESAPFSQAKPVVQNFSLITAAETTVVTQLLGSDADSSSLAYRVVEPPKHGTVAVNGNQVAYTPAPGFSGTDLFTYCARDNRTDSNLALVNIEVGENAEDADIDHDGIPDLVERAFGLNVSRVSRGTAPQITLTEITPGQSALVARHNPELVPPDLSVIFEVSTDLVEWREDATKITTLTDAAGNTVKQVAISPGQRLFLRYRVVRK